VDTTEADNNQFDATWKSLEGRALDIDNIDDRLFRLPLKRQRGFETAKPTASKTTSTKIG
jgi:hypothetical protein